MRRFSLLSLMGLIAWAAPALAHTEADAFGGFTGGFHHPLTGLDHVATMLAVGLWGAYLSGRAIWVLPIVFPLVMVLGGGIAVLGLPLPGFESGIAASALVLGLMVAFAVRAPLWIAAGLVGAFAVFHGYAHGREVPDAAEAVTFFVGFVVATGLLHLAGIGMGLLTRWNWGSVPVCAAGAAIACTGIAFLTGTV